MNKKKQFITIILMVFVMTFSVACGKKENTSSGTDTKKLNKEERVKEAEIEVWAPKGKHTDYLLNAVDLYNKEYSTNLKLKTVDVAPADPMLQKVTPLLVAKNQLPELMYIQDQDMPNILKKFPDAFYDVTNFGFLEKHEKDFYDSKIEMMKFASNKKHLFAFPHDLGIVMAFYRDDLFKQVGIDYDKDIKTWDDLIEAGKKIKAATGKNTIGLEGNGDQYLLQTLMQQNGKPIVDKNGNVNLATDAGKTALDILDKFIKADLVSYYASATNKNDSYKDVAIIIHGSWYAGTIKNMFTDLQGKYKVGSVPALPKGDLGNVAVHGGSGWAVGKNSKNALAAMQLMEFATTNMESQTKLLELGVSSANTAVYETDFANQPDSYFSGDKLFLDILNDGKKSKPLYYYPHFVEVEKYGKLAMYDHWHGKDAEKALNDKASEVASMSGVKVNK